MAREDAGMLASLYQVLLLSGVDVINAVVVVVDSLLLLSCFLCVVNLIVFLMAFLLLMLFFAVAVESSCFLLMSLSFVQMCSMYVHLIAVLYVWYVDLYAQQHC